jgi:diguanylate cyclase (GGDEF)-like protein/PAS domain S-box-containing protein
MKDGQPDFLRIAEHSSDAYFRLIFQDGLASVSPGFVETLGYEPDECLHKPGFFEELINESSRREFAAAEEQLRSGSHPSASCVVRLLCDGGRVIWAELFAVPLEDDAGNVVGMDGLVRDVSQHLQVVDVLSRQSQEQQVLLNVQRDLWTELDLKQAGDLIVRESQSYLKADSCILLLAEPDDVTLRALSAIGDVTTKQLPQIVRLGEGLLGQVVQVGVPQKLEGRGVRGGQLIDRAGKTVLVAPLRLDDKIFGALIAQGGAFEFGKADLEFLNSVSSAAAHAIDKNRSFQEISHQASIDGLTGAFNRRFFETNLPNELGRADRMGYSVGLLFVDVDNLKRINDEHGHLVGDDVLRSLVRQLKNRLRETDWVARYGGDEFAVVLPGCSADQLEVLANKLGQALKDIAINLPAGSQLSATFSIGGSVYPETVSISDNLMAAADEAERAAKQSGGNRIVIKKPHAESGPLGAGDRA